MTTVWCSTKNQQYRPAVQYPRFDQPRHMQMCVRALSTKVFEVLGEASGGKKGFLMRRHAGHPPVFLKLDASLWDPGQASFVEDSVYKALQEMEKRNKTVYTRLYKRWKNATRRTAVCAVHNSRSCSTTTEKTSTVLQVCELSRGNQAACRRVCCTVWTPPTKKLYPPPCCWSMPRNGRSSKCHGNARAREQGKEEVLSEAA